MSASKSEILYLSDADVGSLTIETGEVVAALEAAFRLNAQGRMLSAPKASLWLGPGEGFQSLAVLDTERGVAAAKWIGLVLPGAATATNVNASILLSDSRTGEIRCFMDARRATALRTAGMSALSARYLARSDSTSIGFIGSGVQAHGHLLAFASMLKKLRSVRVFSADPRRAARFAESAAGLGLDASVVTTAEVLAESDVVVTTVPLSPDFEPFLDARATRQGVFVAAIDLGRPWLDESLSVMGVTVIDDEGMRHASKPGSFIPPLEQAEATLSDLVAGKHPGRTSPEQRIILVSSGSAIADLAIAGLIHQKASAAKVGRHLPR